MPQSETPRTITVGVVLGWLIGIMFLLSGISQLFHRPLAAGFILIAGITILPPTVGLLERSMRIKLSGGARVLIVFASLFLGAFVNGESTGMAPGRTAAEPQLELESFNFYEEHGFVEITGLVRNISGEPLENVQAIGEFFTEDETFVKSAEALVEYDPILPGQSSPFRVMTTTNPAIRKSRVTFKNLFGGTIATRRSSGNQSATP